MAVDMHFTLPLECAAIVSNELERRHRVSFDATVAAMAQTAKDMNSKYKETSEAGLAVSVTLC